MAFCGHVNAFGDLVLRDEIYTGSTLVRRSSSPSDSPNSLSSPVSLPQNTARTYSVKNDTDASDASAGAGQVRSPDGWSLMYGELKQNHGVPSLLLSSQASSVNYKRNIDSIKEYREPDAAYENWYSAKRRQRQLQRKLVQQERDYEEELVKNRKQLAEMCYRQWLRGKERQAAAQRMETHMQTAAMKASQSLAKTSLLSPTSSWGSSTILGSGSSAAANRTLRNVSQDKIRKVVEDWWLKKQQQHQAQREEKRRALIAKALEREKRKELAEMAWRRWMSNVDEKPKPVPLNQGMDSLRGTISPLYINPKPWLGPVKPSKM